MLQKIVPIMRILDCSTVASPAIFELLVSIVRIIYKIIISCNEFLIYLYLYAVKTKHEWNIKI